MTAKRAKGAGQIETVLTALGFTLSESDVKSSARYLKTLKDNPTEFLRSVPEISEFLTRTIPNTSLARSRIARSLEGIEYLVRAVRTVIASDDPDLIRGLQKMFKELSEEFFPPGVDRSKVNLDDVFAALMAKVGALVARIPESKDPRVQQAVILIFSAGQALNPASELPRLPAADTVEVRLDVQKTDPARRRTRPK